MPKFGTDLDLLDLAQIRNLAPPSDPHDAARLVELVELLKYTSRIPNAKEHGATGDGDSHPLSEDYATLAEAQAEYPAAIALTDTRDWAAIQSLIDDLSAAAFAAASDNGNNTFPNITNPGSTNPELYIEAGVYSFNRTLNLKGCTLWGTSQDTYVTRQNGYAGAGNIIKGTVLQAIEGSTGFEGTELINASGDNAHLRNITVDGAPLNHGTTQIGDIFCVYDGGKRGGRNHYLGRGDTDNGYRVIVIDPNDPQQFGASIESNDLTPIYIEQPEYEHYLLGWPGPFQTFDSSSWSVVSGSLPPGLSLETNGRLHGTFAPGANDYHTYNFTVQYISTIDTDTVQSVTKEMRIGVITGWVEDFTFPKLTEARSYTYDLTVVNTGSDAHTITTPVNTVPGLSISPSGTVTVTPGANTAGTYSLEVVCTHDASGEEIVRYFENVEIVSAEQFPEFENLNDLKYIWRQGEARSVQAIVSGGTSPLVFSIDTNRTLDGFANANAPTYPREKPGEPGTWEPGPGMELSSTGILSGTPTSSGAYNFYLRVEDDSDRFRTEPVIFNVEGPTATRPWIFTADIPPAIVGVSYSFQLDIRNAGALEDVYMLPLPTGLSVDSTGLITGTPVGVTPCNGVLLRWSAIATSVTSRNFYSGAGFATSGTREINGSYSSSNLHRINHVQSRCNRYGFQIAQAFDSHWNEAYIAGCWIGIKLESGGAAHTFRDIRIEFIGLAGVVGGYANENQFVACYFDTCAQQAIFLENCRNTTIVACHFFRSGRQVPGIDYPYHPNANRKRSSHIYISQCHNTTITGNTFVVGRLAEGVSNNFTRYDGKMFDFARPSCSINYFKCGSLVVSGNNLVGGTNESVVAGGIQYYDSQPVFQGNRISNFLLGIKDIPLEQGNLIRNGCGQISQRQSTYNYSPGGTGSTVQNLDYWELNYGSLQSAIAIQSQQVANISWPFRNYIHFQKNAEPGATAGQTQTMIFNNKSLTRRLTDLAGRTVVISYFVKSNIADSGRIFNRLSLHTGDTAQTADLGGAALLAGSVDIPFQSWRRFHSIIQVPRLLDRYTYENNFQSFVGCQLLLDSADKDYDLYLAGLCVEALPENGLPSPYQQHSYADDLRFCQQRYQKSLRDGFYFGESGANFKNAGTLQVYARGMTQEIVKLWYPTPLDAEPTTPAQVRSYRDANNRGSANFTKASNLSNSNHYDTNVEESTRHGVTFSVNTTGVTVGTAMAMHWELDLD